MLGMVRMDQHTGTDFKDPIYEHELEDILLHPWDKNSTLTLQLILPRR